MGQVLLESLSGRKMLAFGIIMFLCMSVFFILGGTKGADPASANVHIANLFGKSDGSFQRDDRWDFYNPYISPLKNEKEKGHKPGNLLEELQKGTFNASELVFSTKLPHPGSQMHPAFQFMLIIMNVRMDFMPEGSAPDQPLTLDFDCTMEFDAKIAYSNVDVPKNESDWTFLQRVTRQQRPLYCTFTGSHMMDGMQHGYYQCQDQHFLELGSIPHKHYLLNIQLPGDGTNQECLAGYKHFLSGLDFVEIHQNGGYTISLFVSKTVMFPFVMAALLFFVRRVRREAREWLLLERSILWMGVATMLLLLPIDWLTLVTDMPYMLFFSDLRQGLFYVTLLIFWCLFAGEHILDQADRNKLSSYKYEIGCIVVGCISLFIFDSVERGIQMKNPFHTIWKRDAGEKAAKAFIGLAAAAAIFYCLFFIRLLYYVRKNIKIKSVALPSMQEDRRIFYQNKIYRFRVLLYTTLFTVVITVLCFVLDQVNETQWKFQEHSINEIVLVSSAIHFGIFGMWGTYVFSILILYSPDSNADPHLNVLYQRSEHLLSSGPTYDDNEDEEEETEAGAIQFERPKKV